MSKLTGRVRLRSLKPGWRKPDVLVVEVEEVETYVCSDGEVEIPRWRDARTSDIAVSLKAADTKNDAVRS